MGESTTFGYFVDKQEAYPAVVEKILTAKGYDVISINKGSPAIETTAILRNLDRLMITYKPDLVILMAGNNENFIDSPIIEKNTAISDLRIFRLGLLLNDLPNIDTVYPDGQVLYRYNHTALRSYSYRPNVPRSYVASNLREIISTVHNHDSEIWFAGFLQPGPRNKVNPLLREIALEKEITYIGDYEYINFSDQASRYLLAEDNWHPSAKGHLMISGQIAKKIIMSGIVLKKKTN